MVQHQDIQSVDCLLIVDSLHSSNAVADPKIYETDVCASIRETRAVIWKVRKTRAITLTHTDSRAFLPVAPLPSYLSSSLVMSELTTVVMSVLNHFPSLRSTSVAPPTLFLFYAQKAIFDYSTTEGGTYRLFVSSHPHSKLYHSWTDSIHPSGSSAIESPRMNAHTPVVKSPRMWVIESNATELRKQHKFTGTHSFFHLYTICHSNSSIRHSKAPTCISSSWHGRRCSCCWY